MPIARIGAEFYSSRKCFVNDGSGHNRAWIRDLYAKLLFRAPDSAGLTLWENTLRSGFSRNYVAFRFFQSDDMVRLRINNLYSTLPSRRADVEGLSYWTPFLRRQGDLVLASELASSNDYFNRTFVP
jgi:hypothetical protein